MKDKLQTNITTILPVLPWWVRLVNRLGNQLEQIPLFHDLLSVRAIITEAERKTGLSDWGDEDILTPLRLLTEPDAEGLKLTFSGKWYVHRNLVELLVNRLLIQDEVARHPEILSIPVQRPLFIAGMPRTGTTVLQRLLSEDPNSRPLLCWEALHPVPPPDPKTQGTDLRIKRVEREIKFLYAVFPEIASLHYMDARTPEECEWLLKNSLIVPSFVWEFPEFPAYNAWCEGLDKTPAYSYYKVQLQILQWKFPPARWVLKGNEHVNSLGALLSVFPDACIIQTHRDPCKSFASEVSFYLKLLGLKSTAPGKFLARAAREMLEHYARTLERAMAFRRNADPTRFFDVPYGELLRDPFGIIRKIYDHFDLPLNEDCLGRMRRWLAENPQGKHGVHRYSLEQFGLDPEQVRERFSAYIEDYHVPPE